MKILFVCTGNANRSALAETILKKLLRQKKDLSNVEVYSCGTKVPEGLERDEIMCKIAANKKYELGGFALQMNEEILNSADIILAMTDYQKNEITKWLAYTHWNRIHLFNDYCFGEYSDVEDPVFQNENTYLACLDWIEAGCKEIVKRIDDHRGPISRN